MHIILWISGCLLATPAFAAENAALAVYPMIAGSLLVIILALFLYDISRRKQRTKQIAGEETLRELTARIDKLTEENATFIHELSQARSVLNELPYPIWRRDSDFRISYHNRAYDIAVEDTALVDGEVAEMDKKMPAQARLALESGKPTHDRRHLIIKGERKLCDVVEIPFTDDKTTLGMACDISEIEALKEDLARHNSAMNDFLESSASAMAIYGADMRLKSFNYAFVALWKLDEMWLDTHPTYGEILENLREKRKLPEQANFQLFKQQQSKLFRDLINPKEEFFYLPDGRSLRVLAIPHALGGIMFAYEDVTDRLALERSYNTLIAVQRETLDHLHEAVAVFGEDGRLKLSNPNYLRLWNLPEEMAKSEPHVRDIVDRCKPLYIYESWDVFKQQHIQQMQKREVYTQKLERTDTKVIDWRKVPLPDGATLITYLDITDSSQLERSLRERNEALQAADRLKSEFLANVSYELRSPLTSIAGFSEMLGQEFFGPLSDKQREYVDGITQSSQRLTQLINDILDLASIEAGYMRLEVSLFDIAAMMKSVASLIQERIKENKLNLVLECPAKIGRMLGDETRIKQILFNLLSNAIKYSDDGNAVEFGVRANANDSIMIWVEDHGAGIPKEEQQAVFSNFYKGKRHDNSKNKPAKRSGTGLGLSIVKSFIELHGGTIELFSEVGKGTRFECSFLRENLKLKAS